MSEPVAVTARRWKCPHPGCPYSRASKKATAAHIARCWRNPANRACWSCAHYQRASDAGDCIPGRPCPCGYTPPSCDAGQDVPEDGTPVTGCPLWAALSVAPPAVTAEACQ